MESPVDSVLLCTSVDKMIHPIDNMIHPVDTVMSRYVYFATYVITSFLQTAGQQEIGIQCKLI